MRAPSRLVRLCTSSFILALAVVLGIGQVADAAVTDPAKITVVAPTSVNTGTLTKISGKLTDASGKVLKKAPVIISWRNNGTSTWTGSAVVTTSSKGNWSTKITIRLNTQVKASYAGGTTAAAVTSPVVKIAARQSIKITSVSPSRPAIGQLTTLSGTTTKAFRNTKVTLQQRVGGSWIKLSDTKVSSTGTFASSVRVKNAATKSFRMITTSSATISRATSAVRYVSVTVSGTMKAGATLATRRVLSSPNGQYTATMQTDGNLVVRNAAGTSVWESGTHKAGAKLKLSTAGQVSIVSGSKTLWAPKTSATASGTGRLVMQNDGNLVLWSKAKSSWSSKLGIGSKAKPAACWSTSFDCISYTSYNPSIMHWRMYAGHNCVNYVAYRMMLKGVKNPPWGYPGGSAWQWRAGAKKAKIKVDKNPVVGAVMQWARNSAGGGSSGHVVYVEKVTKTSVVVSEDSWSSHASYRTILRSSRAFTDARFLHVADSAS